MTIFFFFNTSIQVLKKKIEPFAEAYIRETQDNGIEELLGDVFESMDVRSAVTWQNKGLPELKAANQELVQSFLNPFHLEDLPDKIKGVLENKCPEFYEWLKVPENVTESARERRSSKRFMALKHATYVEDEEFDAPAAVEIEQNQLDFAFETEAQPPTDLAPAIPDTPTSIWKAATPIHLANFWQESLREGKFFCL